MLQFLRKFFETKELTLSEMSEEYVRSWYKEGQWFIEHTYDFNVGCASSDREEAELINEHMDFRTKGKTNNG